jgi:hypothetical protein
MMALIYEGMLYFDLLGLLFVFLMCGCGWCKWWNEVGGQ